MVKGKSNTKPSPKKGSSYWQCSVPHKQKEKILTSTIPKHQIQEWLSFRNTSFDEGLLKSDIYVLFKSKGHCVLRLPPYHTNLNPIELFGAAIKNYVPHKNVMFNFKNVICCSEFFQQFIAEKWKSRCNRVKRLETEYIKRRLFVDIVVEKLIINLYQDSDDSLAYVLSKWRWFRWWLRWWPFQYRESICIVNNSRLFNTLQSKVKTTRNFRKQPTDQPLNRIPVNLRTL